MRVRAIGWTLSLGVLAVGVAVAAAGAVRNAEARRRTTQTARLLRDRSVSSATHLRDQATESAGQLRDQWNQAAEDVRGRAEEWREKSGENLERALRQAAEAREESLADLPDDEDDRGRAEDGAEEPAGDAGALRDGADPELEPLAASVADALGPDVADAVKEAADEQDDAEQAADEQDDAEPRDGERGPAGPEDEPADDPQDGAATDEPAGDDSGPARGEAAGVLRDGPDPDVEPLTTPIADALGPDPVREAERAADERPEDRPGR